MGTQVRYVVKEHLKEIDAFRWEGTNTQNLLHWLLERREGKEVVLCAPEFDTPKNANTVRVRVGIYTLVITRGQWVLWIKQFQDSHGLFEVADDVPFTRTYEPKID